MTNGITDGGLFGFIYIYYVVVTAIIIVRIDFNIIFYLPWIVIQDLFHNRVLENK